MTVKPPAPPPLPDELDRLLRRLRLPYVRRAAPEVIATATSQRWEHAEVLKVLLAEEAAGRDQATIRTRRRASNLPAGKTFDAWEPERSVIPAQTQQALRTLEWIERVRPRRAILTNLHIDLDYAKLKAELPPGVEVGHDGLRFNHQVAA